MSLKKIGGIRDFIHQHRWSNYWEMCRLLKIERLRMSSYHFKGNSNVKVSPEIREILLKKDKIYAGWRAHYVKDYLGVSRCFKCQGYRHPAQYCREKTDTCGHCTKTGHRVGDCPNKDKREVCANCHRYGQDDYHSTTDRDCPVYKYALEKEILHTDPRTGRKWNTILKEMEDKITDKSVKLIVSQTAFLTERLEMLKNEFLDMELSKDLQDI
ncbi:hypothetical protein J437_LFUL017458 [Ladona fulva]|uniref:CCHC-type domain-containing protein n=1 Tax=Ladona fulva TaxID=123851 RepID=A0A8K0KTE1_LADFU|nr:hypothetical protein J437_LFUL017458 [Ladona fulva]